MKVEVELKTYNMAVGALGGGTGITRPYIRGYVEKNLLGEFVAEVVDVKATFPSAYRFEHHVYGPDQILDCMPLLDDAELRRIKKALIEEAWNTGKFKMVLEKPGA
ncbi:MAG: hypothetical protein AB7G93_09405 [Bdellovibrionales bacterium]